MSTSSLLSAVSAIRAKSAVVIKTARNTGINSDYASYADVMAVLKPLLQEAGVSVGFKPGNIRKDNEAWVQSLTLVVSMGEESEETTFETLFPEGNRGVNITQRQGMAHTYGKRYALVDYFHLITGDDDDAVRLGQPLTESIALKPREDAHWSQFCFVEAFDCGSEETERSWSALADPSDDTGSRTLADMSSEAISRLWLSGHRGVGIDGWQAELIGQRAAVAKINDWSALKERCPGLDLPETFAACTSEQLNVILRTLKSTKA